MTGHVKVAGAWKDLAGASVKVGGAWKEVTNGYTKIGGVWKEWFSAEQDSHELIAELSGAGAKTFSNIPQDYQHIYLKTITKSTWAGGTAAYSVVSINGVATNTYQFNDGSEQSSQSSWAFMHDSLTTRYADGNSDYVQNTTLFPSYNNTTTYKVAWGHVIYISYGNDESKNTNYGGAQTSQSTITSISIGLPQNGDFATQSKFQLWGVRGAN